MSDSKPILKPHKDDSCIIMVPVAAEVNGQNLKGKGIQGNGKFTGKRSFMKMEKGASSRDEISDFFKFLGDVLLWFLLVSFLIAAFLAVYHVRHGMRMKQELSTIDKNECDLEIELNQNPEMSSVASFNVTTNSTRDVILCLNMNGDLGYINHQEIGKLWLDIYLKPYMSNIRKGKDEPEGVLDVSSEGSGATPIR